MQLVHVPAALEAAIIPAIRTGAPGAGHLGPNNGPSYITRDFAPVPAGYYWAVQGEGRLWIVPRPNYRGEDGALSGLQYWYALPEEGYATIGAKTDGSPVMGPLTITDIASASASTFAPSADKDRHDAAQRAALDAHGAARLAGFDEPQQEAAAQSAFAAIAGTLESW